MGKAHNLQEFQAAIKKMQVPMFNVMYADREGHIFAHYLGLVPKRPKGDWNFWSGTLPGDTSALVWNSTLSYDQLPQVLDPPSGWVQNSNSAPWYMTEPFLDPAKFPAYMAPGPTAPGGAPNLREERGLEMITKDAKISLATLMADKMSTRSLLADRVLPDLLAAARQSSDPDAKRAAAVLEKWDHKFEADSRGAELFLIWAIRYARRNNIYAELFDPKRPLETPRGLRDPAKAAAELGAAARRMKELSFPLDVPWGQINRLRRGKFDFPGNGATGDLLGVFRVIEYIPARDGKFEALEGDTFVAAVEFSKPIKAKVILTYGNSSNPDSPHFGDQLEMTSKKEWRNAWLTRSEVEKHLEGRTVFSSDGTITSDGAK
jgi:acyl-homoserine-lactone acylase